MAEYNITVGHRPFSEQSNAAIGQPLGPTINFRNYNSLSFVSRYICTIRYEKHRNTHTRSHRSALYTLCSTLTNHTTNNHSEEVQKATME